MNEISDAVRREIKEQMSDAGQKEIETLAEENKKLKSENKKLIYESVIKIIFLIGIAGASLYLYRWIFSQVLKPGFNLDTPKLLALVSVTVSWAAIVVTSLLSFLRRDDF